MDTTRRRALVLAVLAGLFLLRVVGQALVVYGGATWLPPVDQWQSGLLPYPWLLAAQVLILMFQVSVIRAILSQRGRLAGANVSVGRWLRAISFVYAGGMLLRYIITMTVFPERRWLGRGTIPILFHCALAAWLYVWSRHHMREGRA